MMFVQEVPLIGYNDVFRAYADLTHVFELKILLIEQTNVKFKKKEDTVIKFKM